MRHNITQNWVSATLDVEEEEEEEEGSDRWPDPIIIESKRPHLVTIICRPDMGIPLECLVNKCGLSVSDVHVTSKSETLNSQDETETFKNVPRASQDVNVSDRGYIP